MKETRNITPVVLIVFNRLNTTQRVFEQIRLAKPRELFIISDGPRKNRIDDIEKIKKVRKFIEKHIDWDCNVYRNYSDTNMGCKIRISSGLTWVFQHVEQAIILEDDCLPTQSFFKYCQDLLELYKYDTRISIISGSNIIENYYKVKKDYIFSCFTPIWGWATWKRVWDNFDVDIKQWIWARKSFLLKSMFNDIRIYKKYKEVFDDVYKGKIDTWDYQFFLNQLIDNKLSIIPSKNMIINIGFNRKDALHTKDKSPYRWVKSHEMKFPIKINNNVVRDYKYEKLVFNKVLDLENMPTKVFHFIYDQLNFYLK